MVLTTPLLDRLASRGPVDVVTTPAAAPLLAGHPAVRDVIVYDKRGVARGVARPAAHRQGDPLARRRRAARRHGGLPGAGVGAQRRAGLAVAGIRNRIGFDTSAGRALYTRRVPYVRDRHHAERLWRLASAGRRRGPAGAAAAPAALSRRERPCAGGVAARRRRRAAGAPIAGRWHPAACGPPSAGRTTPNWPSALADDERTRTARGW